MKVAIMQPYFFPYIGYFQLLYAVDTFVVLDDVQYIDRGWVNRNRIELNGITRWLTWPVVKGSSRVAINQRRYVMSDQSIEKIKNLIVSAYRSAHHFDAVKALLWPILECRIENVANFNTHAISTLCKVLDMSRRMVFSSKLHIAPDLRGQERIIDICRQLGATHYYNLPGGMSLYQVSNFSAAGMQLHFLRTHAVAKMVNEESMHLSVIDELMHYGIDGVATRMNQFELLEPESASLSDVPAPP